MGCQRFTRDEIRKKLWDEVVIKSELIANGVGITKEALNSLKLGTEVKEQVHCLFEMDFKLHDFVLPAEFDLPFGISVPFNWNPDADYEIALDKNDFVLTKKRKWSLKD